MSAVTMHHFSGLAAPFVRSKGTVSGGVFTGLERVTIFRYDGEPEESWQNKRAFFTPYCETVVQTHY